MTVEIMLIIVSFQPIYNEIEEFLNAKRYQMYLIKT